MDNKFAFFGTPDVAKDTLDILFNSGYIPEVIVTSPDRRSGRGMHMSQTEVGIWAEEHNIKCLKPEKIDSEFIGEFEGYNIDLSIVIAYGKIVPEKIINIPRLGTINIHYSLLPKYRGASPVEEALLNGDDTTGVSIQQMAYELDSGPIITSLPVDIDKSETKSELLKRLTDIGARLLCENLKNIFEENITLATQDGTKATYCKKIKKEAGLLDLNANPVENYRKYRAFTDQPGVYFFQNNKRVKIKKAKYVGGQFYIERVIPEGKKEMDYKDFLKSNI